MTIKLTCGDGLVLRLQREHFEKSIFNNPKIAAERSYALQCKARSDVVNAVLDVADGESEKVTITEDNFEELQNLCKELGFRGLDKELKAFRGQTGSSSVDLKEFLQLKERVTRQDKRLTELERQLNEVLSWKRKAESVSREFQSLERKVEEVPRACEERNVEASPKTERALRECERQRDLEELSRDLAQLKESPSAIQVRPAKSSEVIETNHAGLPPLNKASPAKPARKRRWFVYDSSKPLDGVIAYLTRECGGNVHDKGIVNVRASSVSDFGSGEYQPKNAVDLGTDTRYRSKNEKGTWICYDFKERRVIPTSYSVRSCGNGPGHCHLKSWVIEVSKRGSSWTEIDRRHNNNDLNDEYATAHFKISKAPSKGFRFFRLKQTGENHYSGGSYYYVELTSLEIFGTLFEK